MNYTFFPYLPLKKKKERNIKEISNSPVTILVILLDQEMTIIRNRVVAGAVAGVGVPAAVLKMRKGNQEDEGNQEAEEEEEEEDREEEEETVPFD